MSDKPDFEALRAERNRRFDEACQRIGREDGVHLQILRELVKRDACYCDCAAGGPCEHTFSGWVEFDNGGSTACSRCGMTAMSHSMRVGP